MEPMTMLGLGAFGGGAISKTLGGMFGANDASDAAREAAREYIAYQDRERNKFLGTNEAMGIRSKLGEMAQGNTGFSPQALQGMRAGVQEDYGRALSDVGNEMRQASVMPGAGYSPGRATRTGRLLGENLAVRKAEANRDITMKNDVQAQNNMRYAISALPSFMPGFSQTPNISPSVFQNLHAPNYSRSVGMGSIGDALMNMPSAMYFLQGMS